MNASIIDGVLSAAAGIYVTLVGFRVFPLTKDKEKQEAVLAKWGKLLKLGGPLIVLWGVYNIVSGL
jgi:hypothetical protein